MGRSRIRDPRLHVVAARLSEAQLLLLQDLASRSGRSLSAIISDLVTIDPPAVTPDNASPATPLLRVNLKPALHAELNTLGNALNMIARQVNALDEPPPGDLAPLILRLTTLLLPLLPSLAASPGTRLTLARPAYHTLNRIAVNLHQIEVRLALLGFPLPVGHADLTRRLTSFVTSCAPGERP